ncbi:MAG: PLP-dependent threonine dehydratase [Candidatus Muproteobacteria bacterium RIFCSPHIGHO2_12_FULL_60_33]|nr:MAG: PLP-dependent threonine dehydratase [Candidatus Muproteobacteria bacterium RIFCSPHIGHO2_01_60_12]OGI54538.1 MAG: PLP-dependent threonine dehydratase [Candidatus Muproteobacteria bacterium RIFCSPHIGHO2_12_FULL_60_33]OGI55978.1 MAG: PLP-dependent threonine dehydratase [Candidatus Muproteobacteria bacterium RIFCSPHIGHO2_02_FULL_60_13]
MPQKYLKKIVNARVYDVARETPLELAPILSHRTGNRVWLKREDEQPVFSFKCRGAYNKMAGLPTAELKKGVVAASAGNHAQGVALAASKLGTKAIIVMPRTTPRIKIDAVRNLGGKVVLHGDNYDAAYAHAREIATQRRLTFVHPYDDPEVIAGQGTIGMEILKQHSGPIHAVFVPVGGGGLIAGIAVYIKQLRPEIKIIGVEPEDADAMDLSLKAGKRVMLDHVGIFADGVAVRSVGKETFRLARQFVDEMVVVSNDEICAAIKDIFEDRRSILEPAGALAYAGLKRYAEQKRLKNKNLIAIASGANVNFDRLRHVAERAEIGERREALFAVTIPERPGALKKFCTILGDHNITEFNYRFADPKAAHIFVGVQVPPDTMDARKLMGALRQHGYATLDMTDNEMAKLHIRHLVGGRAPNAVNEILYRFEFPERPGALMNFLDKMGGRWNISLFHYRSHGADFGRVLVGMQVPPQDKKAFQKFLDNLGYEYVEETRNPAYKLFLS